MRKTLLLILLAVVSSSVSAEWVEVGGSDTENFTSYADPATIRKSDNMVMMWSLLDYDTAHVHEGKTYLSIKAQFEYDCKDE